MQTSRLKTLLPLAAFIWLISPSFYVFWQEASPVDSSLLPPLSLGARILLAPKLMLDLLAYWVWPLGREPLTYALAPSSVLRQGLLYWLILVIVMRFCWRLRKQEPWVFRGPLIALLVLFPCCITPHWIQPFNPLPLLPAGAAMALMVAMLLIRGAELWRNPKAAPNRYSRDGWRFVAVLLVAWIGCLTVNLTTVTGRTWETRLAGLKPNNGQPVDLLVAVEMVRAEAQDAPAESESNILRLNQGAPWYPEIPVVMAEMLIQRGELDAARVHLKRALELHPGHQRAKELMLLID